MVYDVAIIGSGLGGLECAYILASEGLSVIVLERNNQLGGCLQVFSRQKRVFDTGVHYIGALDEGQNLDRYFKFFKIRDKLKVQRMDEVFDRIHFGDEQDSYGIAQGYEHFTDKLSEQFPNEVSGIRKYAAAVKSVCRRFPLYNLHPGKPDYQTDGTTEVNAAERIASFTNDLRLRQVLAGNNVLYAGVKDSTPFYQHALVVNSYIESAWRLVGGGSQIAIELAKNIRALGGDIRKRAAVLKMNLGTDGKVSALVLSTGEAIGAKNVISNAHPAATLDMLDEGRFRKAYVQRVRNTKSSISSFSAHLALKPGSMPYMNYNIHHFKEGEVWNRKSTNAANWPQSLFVSSALHKLNAESSDAISLMSYMEFKEVEPWADSYNTVAEEGARQASYQDFKAEKAEQMIDELERIMPDIRSNIEGVHTSSPLTFRDYIGSPQGSMYGYQKDHKSFMKSYFTAATKVPNLYLTGQNLNLHGILGVTISAFVTCSEFVDMKKLLRKLNSI